MWFILDEDGGNLLFKCKFAKLVWRELLLDNHTIALASLPSTKEVVLSYILDCLEELDVILSTTLWVLWSEPNGVIAGENAKQPSHVSCFITRYVVDNSAQKEHGCNMEHKFS